MNIRNVLLVSPMHKEIETILHTKEVDKRIKFRFRTEEAVTEEDYTWADAFVSFKRPASFMFGNIKWVHSLGAGVDKILKGVKWKDGIVLTRTISSFGQKISEYCLSYILRDVQNHDSYFEMERNKDWNPVAPTPLRQKQVLIFGTGVIGQEVAKVFSFFGMKVYGVSLSGQLKPPFENVFAYDSDYSNILSETDYVINTMPLTSKTTGLFNDSIFSHCRQAMFINAGRGESVDNQALLEALDKEYVSAAVLDVFQEEPLPASDPFWTHPKVKVTPHVSAVTTPEEGLDCFLDTMDKLINNKDITNLVDLRKGF